MEIASIWKGLTNEGRLWAGLFLVTVIAVAPLLAGRFYAVGDMRDVYIPLELFFQSELRAGRLPVWQPDVAWGYPVMAAGQIGFFYPPLLLGRLLAPIWLYLPLILAGHLLLGTVGVYKFIRRLALPAVPAFIGATSFGLGAYWWQHLSHLNIFLSIAWFPWQMKTAAELSQDKKLRLSRLGFFALQLGLPFLIGQFQVPFLMAAVSVIYCAFLRLKSGGGWRSSLLATGGLTLIVLMIAAVQIVPTLQLMQQSSRGADNDFTIDRANQHSYPIYHLPTLLFPRFYGTDDTYWGRRLEIEYGFFVGTLPLILAAIAFLIVANLLF